jgi:hypothetical protein
MQWTFRQREQWDQKHYISMPLSSIFLQPPEHLSLPFICQIIMLCLMTPLPLLSSAIYLLCYLIFHVSSPWSNLSLKEEQV